MEKVDEMDTSQPLNSDDEDEDPEDAETELGSTLAHWASSQAKREAECSSVGSFFMIETLKHDSKREQPFCDCLYLCLLFCGIGLVIPTQIFIIGHPFYQSKFKGHNITEDLETTTTVFSVVGALGGLALIEVFSTKARVLGGFGVSLLAVLFVTVFNLWWDVLSTRVLHISTLVSSGLIAVGTSLAQSSIYGYSTQMPMKYSQAVMMGETVGEITMTLFKNVFEGFQLDDFPLNAEVYQITCLVVLIMAMILFWISKMLWKSRHHVKRCKKAVSSRRVTNKRKKQEKIDEKKNQKEQKDKNNDEKKERKEKKKRDKEKKKKDKEKKRTEKEEKEDKKAEQRAKKAEQQARKKEQQEEKEEKEEKKKEKKEKKKTKKSKAEDEDVLLDHPVEGSESVVGEVKAHEIGEEGKQQSGEDPKKEGEEIRAAKVQHRRDAIETGSEMDEETRRLTSSGVSYSTTTGEGESRRSVRDENESAPSSSPEDDTSGSYYVTGSGRVTSIEMMPVGAQDEMRAVWEGDEGVSILRTNRPVAVYGTMFGGPEVGFDEPDNASSSSDSSSSDDADDDDKQHPCVACAQKIRSVGHYLHDLEEAILHRMEVVIELWAYMLGIATIYLVTNSVYPALLLEVHSSELGNHSSTLLLSVWSTFEAIGRGLASLGTSWGGPHLLILAVNRALFADILLLCVIPLGHALLGHIVFAVVCSAVLALTNGQWGTLFMSEGGGQVSDANKEVAGVVLTTSMRMGIGAGKVTSKAIQWAVQKTARPF